MRFLVLMNMPTMSGALTHQLTLEYPVNSEDELCDALNRNEFLTFKMFYKRQGSAGEVWWQDRGKIVINSQWIAKAQEYQDFDNEDPTRQKRRF